MKKIVELAKVTFSELIREKFFFLTILIAVALFFLSMLLSGVSMEEQKRVLIHFGFLAIQVTLLSLAVILGATAFPKEIEKQTCLLVLVRPLKRRDFLIGKWLGIATLISLIFSLLVVVLAFMLRGEFPWDTYAVASLGVWIESICILSVAMFFSFIFRPAVSVFTSIAFFLIGNASDQIYFLANKSESFFEANLLKLVSVCVPQFHRINWRSHQFIMEGNLPNDTLMAVSQIACWSFFLIFAAGLVFRRKNLV
jgi:Cu-processing system permease protein